MDRLICTNYSLIAKIESNRAYQDLTFLSKSSSDFMYNNIDNYNFNIYRNYFVFVFLTSLFLQITTQTYLFRIFMLK